MGNKLLVFHFPLVEMDSLLLIAPVLQKFFFSRSKVPKFEQKGDFGEELKKL